MKFKILKDALFMLRLSRTSLLFVVLFGFWLVSMTSAQEQPGGVEINGDEVQYSMTDDKVIATGNVIVKREDVTLYCDKITYDRNNSIGIAEGHVVVERKDGRFTGDKMIYNFATMKGDFVDARVTAKPFYGGGRQISREGENHIILDQGYITTCDLDEPHFRMQASKVDIYQGDKAVARKTTFRLGQVPLLFIPRYTQSLKDKQPAYLITPGYKKQWGSFVLSQWRMYLNDDAQLTFHLDYRASKGLGEGADFKYNTAQYGKGLMSIYYIDEHDNDRKYFFQQTDKPSIQTERFEGSWRHKWTIDDRTDAIWQYYRASDPNFLKDYFKKLYEEDSTPPTYFLLTRGLEAGTLSFQATERVNRYVSALDRMPEVAYTLPNHQILDTGFYLQNSTSYSNLVKADPSPSSNRQETMRIDTDNTITYPFKLKFVELSPFAGGRETFYTKTASKYDDNSMRGLFRTGINMSTKFFRVYDEHTNLWGLNINRLRHIVTPSVSYFYNTSPTLESSKLVQFDAIDSLSQTHGLTFGLENKIQTKRAGKSEDLLRFLVTSDFYLKEDTHKGGFNNVISKTDFNPLKGFGVYSETTYDTIAEHMSQINVDVYTNDPHQRWYASVGSRYAQKSDQVITGEFAYRLNQKWWLRTYHMADVMNGIYQRQEYSIVRDLHEWEMRLDVNHDQADGDEIVISFILKEFPGFGFNFGTGFNRVKPGR